MAKLRIAVLATATAVLLAAGATARADCLDEVRAVYADTMDAFARPPYRATRIHSAADGTKISGFDDIVETPLRTISHVHEGQATLAVDGQTWTGAGPDGPWSPAPNMFPADRRAAMERSHAERLANLTEAECHGEVEVDGSTVLHYAYTTKTDPDPDQGGLWFGAREDIHVDPETGLLMRHEMSEFVSSFQAEPNGETAMTVFEYDPSIEVVPPE